MDVGFLRIERELIAEGIDWLKPALRLCERLGGVDFLFHQFGMGNGMIGFWFLFRRVLVRFLQIYRGKKVGGDILRPARVSCTT